MVMHGPPLFFNHPVFGADDPAAQCSFRPWVHLGSLRRTCPGPPSQAAPIRSRNAAQSKPGINLTDIKDAVTQSNSRLNITHDSALHPALLQLCVQMLRRGRPLEVVPPIVVNIVGLGISEESVSVRHGRIAD